MPPKWQDDDEGTFAGRLIQLQEPIALEPQSMVEGFLVFDFMNVSPHLTDDRKLEVMDHNCGRSVLVDTKLGSVYDFT